MRYLALAIDYDGTLAHDGHVDEPPLTALGKLRGSGRKLILVTGRELGELLGVFPRIDLFNRVIAENGGCLVPARDTRGEAAGRAPARGTCRGASQTRG